MSQERPTFPAPRRFSNRGPFPFRSDTRQSRVPHCAPLPRRRPAVRAPSPRLLGLTTAAALSLLAARAASAQNLEDAEMLKRHEVHATVMYGNESWDEYWEGTLQRSNGNVGTVTTRSVAAHLGVGVTERLTVIGALPYVWTE